MDPELVIWPQVACRTVHGVIEAMSPLWRGHVTLVLTDQGDARREMNWDKVSFSSCRVIRIGSRDSRAAVRLVRNAPSSLHMIGSWQYPKILRTVATTCAREGTSFGIWSESPLPRHGLAAARLAYGPYIAGLAALSAPIMHRARFFANSSGFSSAALVGLGWNPERIYPFGYFPPPRPSMAKPIDGPALRMLTLGHLKPIRRTEDAILATAALAARGVDAELDIVGDGPSRPSLQRIVARMRLETRVRFHGFISEQRVEQLISQTSIMLCTGLAEPWGVRVNEGLLSGFVVVSSDRIGASELLSRHGAGFVFRPADTEGLIAILESVAAMPEIGRRMQARAIAVGELIGPERAAGYLVQILRHALALRGPRPVAPWHVPLGSV